MRLDDLYSLGVLPGERLGIPSAVRRRPQVRFRDIMEGADVNDTGTGMPPDATPDLAIPGPQPTDYGYGSASGDPSDSPDGAPSNDGGPLLNLPDGAAIPAAQGGGPNAGQGETARIQSELDNLDSGSKRRRIFSAIAAIAGPLLARAIGGPGADVGAAQGGVAAIADERTNRENRRKMLLQQLGAAESRDMTGRIAAETNRHNVAMEGAARDRVPDVTPVHSYVGKDNKQHTVYRRQDGTTFEETYGEVQPKADTSTSEFEAWQKQNPNGKVEDYLRLAHPKQYAPAAAGSDVRPPIIMEDPVTHKQYLYYPPKNVSPGTVIEPTMPGTNRSAGPPPIPVDTTHPMIKGAGNVLQPNPNYGHPEANNPQPQDNSAPISLQKPNPMAGRYQNMELAKAADFALDADTRLAKMREDVTHPNPQSDQDLVYNHIAMTIGAVRGGRVTNDIIHQHIAARSLPADVLVMWDRVASGKILDQRQRERMLELGVRTHDMAWRKAKSMNEAWGNGQQLPQSIDTQGQLGKTQEYDWDPIKGTIVPRGGPR